MPVTHDDRLFGKIAVKNRIISGEQLAGFMEAKENLYPDRDLGQIILEAGAISEKQYQAILKALDKVKTSNGSQGASGAGAAFRPGAELMTTQQMPALTESVITEVVEEVPAPAAPVFASRPASGRSVSAGQRSTPPGGGAPGQGGQARSLLTKARTMGASDLHVASGIPPTLRLHGKLTPSKEPPLTVEDVRSMLSGILKPEQLAQLDAHGDLDLAYNLEGVGRFRANCYRHQRGMGATFRVIADKIPTLEDLGLPSHLKKLTTYHQGLVLITGPAGSGKSSTLAALVEIVNRERKDHIITVEDPIEFVFESKSCNVTQRQVELHTQTWPGAIRAALREDPDVIMIGEMRDLATISTAITAAETGHLVFGTLHTVNATRSVDRLLDVFPPKEQAQIRAMLSESLRGVISQQLVPKADGKGRVPVLEILYVTPAVANLVRDSKTFQLPSIMQTGRKQGMVLMDDSLTELVNAGTITKEEAQYRATDPKRFGGKAE